LPIKIRRFECFFFNKFLCNKNKKTLIKNAPYLLCANMPHLQKFSLALEEICDVVVPEVHIAFSLSFAGMIKVAGW